MSITCIFSELLHSVHTCKIISSHCNRLFSKTSAC